MPSTIGPLAGLLVSDFKHRSGKFFWHQKSESILEIEICSGSLKEAMSTGEAILVFVAEVIREDGRALFGFESLEERDVFLSLKELDSVGNKTAALIVRELGIKGLRQLMNHGASSVGKIPGLGPKTLDKIKAGLIAEKAYFEGLFSAASQKKSIYKSSDPQKVEQNPKWDSGVAQQGEVAGSHSSPSLPDVVVAALTQLGVPSSDVFFIYDKLCEEESSVNVAMNPPELIKKMLSVWSRIRQNKQVRIHEKEEGA